MLTNFSIFGRCRCNCLCSWIRLGCHLPSQSAEPGLDCVSVLDASMEVNFKGDVMCRYHFPNVSLTGSEMLMMTLDSGDSLKSSDWVQPSFCVLLNSESLGKHFLLQCFLSPKRLKCLVIYTSSQTQKSFLPGAYILPSLLGHNEFLALTGIRALSQIILPWILYIKKRKMKEGC